MCEGYCCQCDGYTLFKCSHVQLTLVRTQTIEHSTQAHILVSCQRWLQGQSVWPVALVARRTAHHHWREVENSTTVDAYIHSDIGIATSGMFMYLFNNLRFLLFLLFLPHHVWRLCGCHEHDRLDPTQRIPPRLGLHTHTYTCTHTHTHTHTHTQTHTHTHYITHYIVTQ